MEEQNRRKKKRAITLCITGLAAVYMLLFFCSYYWQSTGVFAALYDAATTYEKIKIFPVLPMSVLIGGLSCLLFCLRNQISIGKKLLRGILLYLGIIAGVGTAIFLVLLIIKTISIS